MGIFSDAQGQLTLLSVVGSGRISNSCKLLCMSQLPASIKKDPIKKQLRKRDDALFPIITLWELSVAMENQSF